MKKTISILFLAVLITIAGCKKNNDPVSAVDTTLNMNVILGISANVASAGYVTLAAKTATLQTQVLALEADQSEPNLAACRTTWREAREVWEQSEALLFGPVSTDLIDPRIDTWPVNFADLENQLDSDDEFTAEYINNLEDALKGFHPIEYLLFGEGGNKAAANITEREMEYLKALTLNLKTLTGSLADKWVTSSSSNYFIDFSTAGRGSSVYTTQRAVLQQLVTAMTDICDEVANAKIKEPYEAQDPSLEESPFAKSSITDFTNNINGIMNVYQGKFATDGLGLEDIVRNYNLSLDSEIKAKHAIALGALANITEPFGEAIINDHTKVETAMAAINDLKTTLDEKLMPFITEHSN